MNVSSTAAVSFPRTLFRRLVLINGTVFTVGTLALALSPATVSSPLLLTEIPVLVVGLALILGATTVLLRRSLVPLEALTDLMKRVDPLRYRGRLPVHGHGDLDRVVATFNAMLDRLDAERDSSAAAALAAQESERSRIARELHDEIGQTLTAALLELKRVADRAPAELGADVGRVQETVRAGLEEVRRVAKRLRPDVLEDLGLVSALAALASEFTAVSGVPVTRSVAADLPGAGADVELVLFRVTQEALTNAARHAAASHVELTLRRAGEHLVLQVLDDGRGGAPADDGGDDEGAGVRGMRERAVLVGARLRIESPPGRGTLVELTVPITPGSAA